IDRTFEAPRRRRASSEVPFHVRRKQPMTSLQPYMDREANGPSYLTDIEVDEEGTSTAEEVWHVAISWDDIKTMTLDQLDDAFRLAALARAPAVWREGMPVWQPLWVVAGRAGGADDDDAPVMTPAPPQRRPAPQRRSPPPAAARAPSPPARPPARATEPP